MYFWKLNMFRTGDVWRINFSHILYIIDFSKVTQCSHRIFKTENVLHFVFALIKSDCRLRSARRGVPFIHNPLAHSSGVSRHLQPFIGCLWVYSWSLLFHWTYDISAYYTRVHLSMPIIASGLMNGLLKIKVKNENRRNHF